MEFYELLQRKILNILKHLTLPSARQVYQPMVGKLNLSKPL